MRPSDRSFRGESSIPGWLATLVRQLRDGVAAAQWLNTALRRVGCLLARARRQRNAITHSTRTVPDVVESVEPFLSKS